MTGSRLRRLGRYAEAEPYLLQAVAEAERAGGEAELVGALNELGLWCKAVGRYSEAVALYRRALTLMESHGDADSDDLASLHHNLAGIEHARGAYAAGEAIARHGLAIRLGGPCPGALGVAVDLIALAALLDGQSRWDEAEALYVTGLSMLERIPEEPTLELAVGLSGLGSHNLQRGRPDVAVLLLRRAARLKRRTLGPTHPDLAVTLHNLAEAYSRSGPGGPAAELRAEAIGILERGLGANHPWRTACRGNLPAEPA